MKKLFRRFSISLSLFAAMALLSACGSGGGADAPDLIRCDDVSGQVVGEEVALSCIAASDVSGLSLEWAVTAPGGGAVAVTPTAGELGAVFTPQRAGTYKVAVTATSGQQSETERFDVIVANPPPTVECGSGPIRVKKGQKAVIDCQAADPSGAGLTFAWTVQPPAGVSVQLDPSDQEDLTFTPPATGAYALTLTVTAADGQSATVNVQVNVQPAGTWKIVLIGDSITQSNKLHDSYRYPFWKKLVDSGIDFDLVGTQTENSNQCVKTETISGVEYACNGSSLPANTAQLGQAAYKGKRFDPDHEGYWGETAGQVLTRLQTSLPALQASNKTPDVAVIHLGTNDIYTSTASLTVKTGTAIDGLEDIVDELRAVNPDVVILIAQVIPYENDGGQILQLNRLIDALDDSLSTPNSPLIVVDQYTGFSVSADTFDGIHPSASGEEKLATGFFNALKDAIGIP